MTKPGFTTDQAARPVCVVPGGHAAATPLSPWLRLAHRRRPLATPPTKVPLQHLLDFEMLLVLEGSAWLWVEPAGGAVRLGKGSLALIPPGLVHTWGGTADHHLAVHFDLCARPEVAPLENMIVSDRWVTYRPAAFPPRVQWEGFGGALTPIFQTLADAAFWAHGLEELVAISAGRTSADLSLEEQAAAQSLLLDLVTRWVRLEAEKSAPNDSSQRVRALLRHLDPTRRDAIEDLAEQAHLCPTAFRTAFRAVTGQSPRRWLESRRVDLAARRLLNTNLPVAAIAAEVGYEDAFHFSRVFRRVTGTPPATYRRQVRDSTG